MRVTIEPQAVLFEKPSCYHDGHSRMGSGVLWKIMSKSTQSKPLIKKCNLKLYYAKRKAFINFAQKCRRVLLAGSHPRWTERQWKHVFGSDESTFHLVFGKNRRRSLDAKEKKYHPDCYQRKVQKSASVMVWRCISAHSTGDLHIPLMQRLMLEFWRDICSFCTSYNSVAS